MSDILVGVVAFTAALTMYALGYWAGRSAERERADRVIDTAREVRRRLDAGKLSARRRAHRGRLLAQLLRESRAREPEMLGGSGRQRTHADDATWPADEERYWIGYPGMDEDRT